MRFLGLVITTDARVDRLTAFHRELGRMDGHREGLQEGVRRGMMLAPIIEAVQPRKPRSKKDGPEGKSEETNRPEAAQ